MKKFFTKKKIVLFAVLALVIGGVGYSIARGNDPSSSILTEKSKIQDIRLTVLATGQVVSATDLQLGFKASGVVSRVNVKEGESVKSGQVLAVLEQKDQMAALTTARGGLAQARANYQKVLAGASSEEVQVAERAVDAARTSLDNASSNLETVKRQQEVLVGNAYSALLNSTLSATPASSNTGSVTATVSGTYVGSEQGQYKVSVYATGGGLRFQVSGLESADGPVSITPEPMGSKGLYIQFSSLSVPTNNVWNISIPNTQATNYVTNFNAYTAAKQSSNAAINAATAQVNTAQASLAQAEASLNLKRAAARPADISSAQAQILSAEGQVLAAEAAVENTIIRAPADGVITSVDIKTGEQATALKPVIVLQDVKNLHVEANVSEANIAFLKPGQAVEMTFDALGPDRNFQGVIRTINPASTVVSGVVNYKVVATVDKIEEIKPGMTANMEVLVAEKSGVLAVPQRAVIAKDRERVVRVITDAQKKTFQEVPVQTGMEADGGLVEIVSGLSEGQEIVTLIKK